MINMDKGENMEIKIKSEFNSKSAKRAELFSIRREISAFWKARPRCAAKSLVNALAPAVALFDAVRDAGKTLANSPEEWAEQHATLSALEGPANAVFARFA